MTSVLTSLASRKLEAARKAALLHLQARQETIELIHRAEEVADYQLPWDWQKITSEDVPASEINAAEYLTVLFISDKAVASNRQLLVDAREQMARLEKKRSAAVEKLCLSVSDLKMETEQIKTAASNKLREAQTNARQLFANRKLPIKPEVPSDASKGCGVGCLTFCLAPVGGPFLAHILGVRGDSVASFLWACLCLALGFFGVPLIQRHFWSVKCDSIEVEANKESQQLLRDAETEYANDLAVIDRHMPNHINARATEHADAEALLSKARDASAMVLAH